MLLRWFITKTTVDFGSTRERPSSSVNPTLTRYSSLAARRASQYPIRK